MHNLLICITFLSSLYSLPIMEKNDFNVMNILKSSEFHNYRNLLPTFNGTNTKTNTQIDLYDFLVNEFEQYKSNYNKVYKDEVENEKHFFLFLTNMMMIKTHNEQFQKGEHSYEMGINHMSDMHQEELELIRGFKEGSFNESSYIPLKTVNHFNIELPLEIDWRKEGAVSPVKDQALCSSCYAFSATGSLEGQMWRKTGKLISLSEQQIIDCDNLDFKCVGGDTRKVFTYIKNVGGIMSEEAYPYTSGHTRRANKNCNFIKSEQKAKDTGFIQVVQDERKIQELVATMGPVSVSIDADPLLFYKSGIFYKKGCGDFGVIHAVLIVGYGTDKETGTDYWIVKNSWGPNWGEDGYIRMKRNVNTCGIKTLGVVPVV